MENDSLLSVRQLYNEGYYVAFDIDGVTIFKSERNTIMKRHRYLDTGLWRINLCPNNQQTEISKSNNINELRNTGSLVNYFKKALFSP